MVPFNCVHQISRCRASLVTGLGSCTRSSPSGSARAQRRVEVHRRMDLIKHSREGAVSHSILGLIGMTPPQIERRLVDLFASKSILVLTNVPGPRQPVYLAGHASLASPHGFRRGVPSASR